MNDDEAAVLKGKIKALVALDHAIRTCKGAGLTTRELREYLGLIIPPEPKNGGLP